mgnify:CR=1 FL=1
MEERKVSILSSEQGKVPPPSLFNNNLDLSYTILLYCTLVDSMVDILALFLKAMLR